MAAQPELTQISQHLAVHLKQQGRFIGVRPGLREPKNEVLIDHEERLCRLEDFMRRAS